MPSPTPVAVTGNLQSLLGANAAGTLVTFQLINSGWNIPLVSGVAAIIDPQVFMTANSSGALSGNIWGNDVIIPAGTQYLVSVGRVSNTYSITGSTWDLNTATPST